MGERRSIIMLESLLSALKNCIGFIQRKLSDFFGSSACGSSQVTKQGVSKAESYTWRILSSEGLFEEITLHKMEKKFLRIKWIGEENRISIAEENEGIWGGTILKGTIEGLTHYR